MKPTSSKLERMALHLALSLASSKDSHISRQVIEDHFGAEADLLVSMGILAPDGHGTAIATEQDLPAIVAWQAERDSFGYFSEEGGWIDVDAAALTTFALQVRPLVSRLTSQLDVLPVGLFDELSPGVLWELGSCRLPGRAKRSSVWVARRLNDGDVWRSFLQATRNRPTPDLRVVLHLAESEVPDLPFVGNHAILAAGSVRSASDPFLIDAETLAARLQMPQRKGSPISVSADGGHVTVHGNSYTFSGSKQRAIVRHLYQAWVRGEPRCLTEEVLLEAESGATVRRLARAFNGHPDWHEIIKEKGGFCWLEI